MSDVSADHTYNMNDGMINPVKGADTQGKKSLTEEGDAHSRLTKNSDKDGQVKECAKSDTEGAVMSICPFVCGICSEKFDKMTLFSAHLKTHENLTGKHFALQEKNKKQSRELHDQGKVDADVFNCGICTLKFPSMSLLHEHMVGEENISDYSYSNADHTARPPDSLNNKPQSDSDAESEITDLASSSNGEMSYEDEKEKGNDLSTLKTQKDAKAKESTKINDRLKNLKVEKKLTKKGQGVKRRMEENEEVKTRKTEKNSKIRKSSPISDMNDVISTYGTRGNLSPVTRSSRRSSCKRVDYKALAGISSPKYESENRLTNASEPAASGESVKATECKNVRNSLNHEKLPIQKDTIQLETELENDKTVIKGSGSSKKKIIVKVFPKEKDSSDTAEEVKCLKENQERNNIEIKAKDVTSVNDDKKIADSNEETVANVEDIALKTDGTSVDADTENSYTAVKVEIDSDYNASDNDSDDDFGEDESHDEDDDQNDPDFIPQEGTEEEDIDHTVSVSDTNDRQSYLNKFKVKKKRIFKNEEGQPMKNCLYPCAVCGRYFLWKALKKHMFAHVSARIVECAQCGKKYKSKRHLNDHVRSVHTMKKYGCPKCSSILKGNQSFEKHIMSHILKREITEPLDEVEKVEVSEEDYIKWRSQQIGKCPSYQKKKKKSIWEDKREESGLDLEILKEGPLHGEHIVLESEVVGTWKNQDCKICKKHFVSHESLLTHMLEHKEEQHFSCKSCKGFFQTAEHLKNHIDSVHGERDIVCDICGEHLRSRYALWSHKGKHLMKKDEYYSEEIVQKLQEEMPGKSKNRGKFGTGGKQELKECEVCGMQVMAVRYKRHMEVHNTTKDWECDICHNFYKTRRYLIDHKKKTHFSEMVTCDICGQKFKGKSYLEIHKQTHGPRDKKCPHCDKGFTTIMYLKAHLLTHEEKKRFRCEKCMAAFSHKQRLSIHLVEVHGEGASRPCKYCGELFPSRQKARRHERIAHEGFVMPTRVKKKQNYVNIFKVNETDNESLESKIVRLMPAGSEEVSVLPGIVKIPFSKNKAVDDNTKISTENQTTSDSSGIVSSVGKERYIKLQNGDEYKVMFEKEGDASSLEFVELTEDEQNIIIQEADGIIAEATPETPEQGEHVEQILEIPDTAEQCQILLYPDRKSVV